MSDTHGNADGLARNLRRAVSVGALAQEESDAIVADVRRRIANHTYLDWGVFFLVTAHTPSAEAE